MEHDRNAWCAQLRMPLELHSNDNAREARPGLWIFSGKWVVLLPVGIFLFIGIFRILMSLQVDWFLTLPIALMPMVAFTVFVWTFVNGKAASYATDMWLLALWRLKAKLYLAGMWDRAPVLWSRAKIPMHPNEF